MQNTGWARTKKVKDSGFAVKYGSHPRSGMMV